MIAKSAALVLAFSAQALAACQNNATFTKVSFTDDGNPLKTCKQIRQKEERRSAMCVLPDVNAACPHTCGSCCEDDTTYSFKLKRKDVMVDCSWILKNEKKKEIRFNNYCTKNNTKGKLHTSGGRSVRDACAVSCDYCFTDTAITVPPTSAPTAAPVATVAPTVSSAPSQQPTRPPSPMPSPFPSMAPSTVPSDAPSLAPSDTPSDSPSLAPSDVPSLAPSDIPSDSPSLAPSDDPSSAPSLAPSDAPSLAPSDDPSDTPSSNPTASIKPSPSPSSAPSKSKEPTPAPTPEPTAAPTNAPGAPTSAPTPAPTACVDDPAYTFSLINDPTISKGCSWLLQHKDDAVDTKRTTSYCGVVGTVATSCCASCSA